MVSRLLKPPLRDQAARDRIEQRLDETLFVEAGAGTGKTHQLVQRIVNLIEHGGIRANEIAAITFTEKAAAELYDRVLEELDTQRQDASDPARQALFAEAAEQLDYAAIETLHSFAGRILRMHPLEAGLPPGFQIADESEAALKFDQRWRGALDEMLDDEALAEPLLALFDAGLDLRHFLDIAMALHADWDRAEATQEMDVVEYREGVAPFIETLGHVIGQRGLCSDDSDKMYVKLIQLQAFHQQLEAARDDPGKLIGLLKHTTPTSLKVSRTGRAGNWSGGALTQIRETMKALDEQRVLLRERVLQSCFAPVFNALRRFILVYADERRRRGELEFQDLLVRASRLLSGNAAVQESMRARFSRLLIDEFQDNDPLQTEIIDNITRGEPGRAFYVGDPKQSIYRFRRADIQQFNDVKRKQLDGLTRLTQNFRSTPGVTEFVNAVFQPMMGDGGPDQAQWEDLNAYRDAMRGVEHAVTVIGGDYEDALPIVRRREADALARMITDIEARPWQVYDKAADGSRDAHLADTAVLVPTRTGLRELLPALERDNIPYRLESRSLVYDTREVRDLLNLLHAIEDPTDEVALVAALHSHAFACADDDLYRWKQAGGRWDYRRNAPSQIAPNDPVAEAMQWLRGVAASRWELSVSELVGRVIRERRLMELAVVERQPREHWSRYRFMHDQARAFCDRGGATLSEFLTWAEFQAAADTRVVESVVPEEDHDAVRIMTIHAAKGLEFPIVIFAGLNSQPRVSAPPLLWAEDGHPEIKLGEGLQTPRFQELWDAEKLMQEQEYVRRNYVGATRARDHLVMSLYHKSGSKSDAAKITELLKAIDAPCRYLTDEELPARRERSDARAEEPQAGSFEDRERWLHQRAESIRQHASLPREPATGVHKLAKQISDAPESPGPESPGAERNFEPADDLPPWRRGRAGTAIGRATHGVLQVIDLAAADPDEVRRAARAQAAAESLTGPAERRVEELAQRAARSATVAEAVAADRYWRELYAAAEIDGVMLDGFIDLLYELPNGHLVVVDYKTDALGAGQTVADAVERYRLQAASYALMLEESLGRTVERAMLLFLEPSEERIVPNLAQSMAEVREALRESQP